MIWCRNIDVAAPDPHLCATPLDEGQRLRIVHDDHVVDELRWISDVVENDGAVKRLLLRRRPDWSAMQGIVDLFREGEKVRLPVDDQPVALKPKITHQWREAGKNFCHAATVPRGIDVEHPETLQTLGLLVQAFGCAAADERLVLVEAQGRRPLPGHGCALGGHGVGRSALGHGGHGWPQFSWPLTAL